MTMRSIPSVWIRPIAAACVAAVVTAPQLVAQVPVPGAATPAAAPALSQDPWTLPLWNGPAPGAKGTAAEDVPTLTVYMPRNTAGPMTAVVLAPGGSYVRLAMNHEGRQTANLLNSFGVAVFVLQYRLGPKYQHTVEIGDVRRALRTVRARAAEWHLAPDKIGVMGYSAGGHLAASASTMFDSGDANASDPVDRKNSRPDFAILGYPVISMTESWTHQGSKTALIGANASADLARSMSLDTRVTKDTPPTFIFQTNADTTVPAENSVMYYLALRKAGVPAEMHIFKNGAHGLGLAQDDPTLGVWTTLLNNWMRTSGLTK
jgi:acetyl esterase/lipase